MLENTVGKVIDLFISVKDNPKRVNTDSITLDRYGVLGDKFYSKDDNRAILVTSLFSYELAKENGIDMPYGSLGENILIEHNIYSLRPGDRFKIGDITVELTQNCTLCNSLSKVDSKLPKLLKNDRGVFVKAIGTADVKKGDNISLLYN